MRKPNNANKFAKFQRLRDRLAKIEKLRQDNNQDARKQRKAMNVSYYGRKSGGDSRGFYGKQHCKPTKKQGTSAAARMSIQGAKPTVTSGMIVNSHNYKR